MSELSERIIALRAEGKTYPQIESELGCSRSTISYYLGDGQKAKSAARMKKLRAENTLVAKTATFQTPTKTPVDKPVTTPLMKQRQNKVYKFQDHVPVNEQTFTYRDVASKFGDSPTCYLSGDPIDLASASSYHFDHIVPRSKGGENSLGNLGLATKQANQMKGDMSLDEFLDMCEKVLRHHGRM